MPSEDLLNSLQLAIKHKYVDPSHVLHQACINDDVKIAELAIKNGADITDRIFIKACEYGNIHMIKLLVSSIKDGRNTRTVFSESILRVCMGKPTMELVKYLFDHGARMYVNDFQYICGTLDLPLVKFVIDAIDLPNHKYKLNFLDHGLSGLIVNKKNDVATELCIAEILLNLGADNLNAAAINTIYFIKFELLDLLIKHGANNFNECMKTAIYIIQDHKRGITTSCNVEGLLKIMKLLIQYGASHYNIPIYATMDLLNMNCDLVNEHTDYFVHKRKTKQSAVENIMNNCISINNYDVNITNIIKEYIPYEVY